MGESIFFPVPQLPSREERGRVRDRAGERVGERRRRRRKVGSERWKGGVAMELETSG